MENSFTRSLIDNAGGNNYQHRRRIHTFTASEGLEGARVTLKIQLLDKSHLTPTVYLALF